MAPWRCWLAWCLPRRGQEDDRADSLLRELPNSTRRFISVLRVPASASDPGAVVFLLAVQTLSERSTSDTLKLISAVRPKLVIAEIEPGSLQLLRSRLEKFPTSFFGVVSDCFSNPERHDGYEEQASQEVLHRIFGTQVQGHILRAKDAATECDCPFLCVESPSIVPRTALNSNRVAPLAKAFASTASPIDPDGQGWPSYAASWLPFFVELSKNFPGMKQALHQARKLLADVDEGRQVDPQQLAETQELRLAVETMRISFTAEASRSSNEPRSVSSLEELPADEQGYFLLAKALQEQGRKHGNIVAVCNASSVPGIRRYWDTRTTPEVAAKWRDNTAVYDLSVDDDGKNSSSSSSNSNSNKVLLGSGTVAAAGLAWYYPTTSSLSKLVMIKAGGLPKLVAVQMKRMVAAKCSSSVAAVAKAAGGAGKARAAAHGVVTSAERAALSAVRTAFYSVMRKKQGMPAGRSPWLLLGGSVASVAGVVWFGNRLEAAIEVAPRAPRLARLGRGLQGLERASASVSAAAAARRWDDLYLDLERKAGFCGLR